MKVEEFKDYIRQKELLQTYLEDQAKDEAKARRQRIRRVRYQRIKR